MQPWLVEWALDAQEQLADLWLRSDDRQRITIATDQLEHILLVDPRRPGKEASEGLWKISVAPLHALYEIDDDRRLVIVTAIGLVNE